MKLLHWRLFCSILVKFLFLVSLPCSSSFTLITFDVDGTLVKGSGKKADASAHARAFALAAGKLMNEPPTAPIASILPRRDYHGSTDGLILCRVIKAVFDKEIKSNDELQQMMGYMYSYIAGLSDEEVAKGISPLPGVMETLRKLSTLQENVACGLVTGNVEGIARRKMKAVGVFQTGALAPPSLEQREECNPLYPGTETHAFLGGFGSDYCSLDITDPARNYLDRGEQIAIATRRCQSSLIFDGGHHQDRKVLTRVVHVGDAPADILAAKSFAERQRGKDGRDSSICVGCVGVATGSYSAKELKELAGDPIPGRWEPVILEEGMASPDIFLEACGL